MSALWGGILRAHTSSFQGTCIPNPHTDPQSEAFAKVYVVNADLKYLMCTWTNMCTFGDIASEIVPLFPELFINGTIPSGLLNDTFVHNADESLHAMLPLKNGTGYEVFVVTWFDLNSLRSATVALQYSATNIHVAFSIPTAVGEWMYSVPNNQFIFVVDNTVNIYDNLGNLVSTTPIVQSAVFNLVDRRSLLAWILPFLILTAGWIVASVLISKYQWDKC